MFDRRFFITTLLVIAATAHTLDLDLRASALYLKPSMCHPQIGRGIYGAPGISDTIQRLFFAKPNSNWGVAAAARADWACAGAWARYRHVGTRDSLFINRGNFDILAMPSDTSGNVNVSSISGCIKTDYQHGDIGIARAVSSFCYTDFAVTASLNWTRINFSYSATGARSRIQIYNFSSRMNGIGPAIGFAGACHLYPWLVFRGELNTGSLVTKRKRGAIVTTDPVAIATRLPSALTSMIYFVQADFRVSIRCLVDCMRLQVSAGFLVDHYFDGLIYPLTDNLNAGRTIPQPVQTCHDVDVAGPYLSATVGF